MKSFKNLIPIFALVLTGFFLEASVQEAQARPRKKIVSTKKVYKKRIAKPRDFRPYSSHYKRGSRRGHGNGYVRGRGHRHVNRPRQVIHRTRTVYRPAPIHVHTPWCDFHRVYHTHYDNTPYYGGSPYWNLGINSNGQFQLGIGW